MITIKGGSNYKELPALLSVSKSESRMTIYAEQR